MYFLIVCIIRPRPSSCALRRTFSRSEEIDSSFKGAQLLPVWLAHEVPYNQGAGWNVAVRAGDSFTPSLT